jgi:hypothetical protein
MELKTIDPSTSIPFGMVNKSFDESPFQSLALDGTALIMLHFINIFQGSLP